MQRCKRERGGALEDVLQQVNDAVHGDLRRLQQRVAAAQHVLHVQQHLALLLAQLRPAPLLHPGAHLLLDPLCVQAGTHVRQRPAALPIRAIINQEQGFSSLASWRSNACMR
jgi:hypothetical protein